jgi:tripartite-type tricarboxylate transporter receptor subunit TctC
MRRGRRRKNIHDGLKRGDDMNKHSGRWGRRLVTGPGMALAACALWIVGCGAASGAGAADAAYPQRPITIMVPFTPGTSADVIARLFAARLADRWKVPVVIDNRAGASGNIGTEYVARAAPDGYTMLFTATAFGTNPLVNKKIPFDPIKDFRPIGLSATSAMALVVAPRLNVNSVAEFVELARAQPGKLNYASPGTGTAQHLAMELLKQRANVDIIHVPYKGTAGALTDVMAGHVQAMVTSLAAAAPFVQSKQLKMLAVMSGKRSSEFPDVSTMQEQGFNDFVVDTWYGMLAPAGTSDAMIAKWNTELNLAMRNPDMVSQLASQGLIAANGTPEAFGQLLQNELTRWGQVVARAGITAD